MSDVIKLLKSRPHLAPSLSPTVDYYFIWSVCALNQSEIIDCAGKQSKVRGEVNQRIIVKSLVDGVHFMWTCTPCRQLDFERG